jgi:hypothetical protein
MPKSLLFSGQEENMAVKVHIIRDYLFEIGFDRDLVKPTKYDDQCAVELGAIGTDAPEIPDLLLLCINAKNTTDVWHAPNYNWV